MGWAKGVWDVTDKNGKSLTKQMAEEAAEKIGTNDINLIRKRVTELGWTVEDALIVPAGVRRSKFRRSPVVKDGRPYGFPALKLEV